MLPAFEAVIFDMDGLLLDTDQSYALAWKKAARAFAVELDDAFIDGLFGQHADAVEDAMRQKIGSGFDHQRFLDLASQSWHAQVETQGIALMPGAMETVGVIRQLGIPFALATNSDAAFAEICLERAGVLEHFPVRVYRDDVSAGKPAPDLFIEAAKRLQAPICQTLILEDSETGLLAANRAQALPVLVTRRPVSERMSTLALAAFSTLHQVRAAMLTQHSTPIGQVCCR